MIEIMEGQEDYIEDEAQQQENEQFGAGENLSQISGSSSSTSTASRKSQVNNYIAIAI